MPGLPPSRDVIPQYPYTQEDVNTARRSKTLPPRRDVNGLPVVAIVNALAPVLPVVNIAPQLPQQPAVTRPTAQEQQELLNPDQYPFSFWPPRPWESIDARTDRTLNYSSMNPQQMGDSTEFQDAYLDSHTHYRPNNDGENFDERQWRGSEFLGAGGYGCVALWCKVDENNNVRDVS